MQPERRTELLELLRDAPRRVEELLRGQPRNVLTWVPAPGKWTVVEIVCHLRDHELPLCLEPYRRIAAGERPLLPLSEPDSRASVRGTRGERVSEAIRVWKRTRREALDLLEALDPEVWSREAEHPVVGPIALAALVEMQVQHDRDHLAQIESNLERRSILDRLEIAQRQMRERVDLLAAGAPDSEPRAAGLREITRLRDFETRMLARYVRILEHDRPELEPLEMDSPTQRACDSDLLETWREFEQIRDSTLELLHAIGPRLWQRRGVHPHRGDLSIAELVAHQLDHDAARLAALRGLTARRPSATLSHEIFDVEGPRPSA